MIKGRNLDRDANRLDWIDSAKGIGILGVVAGHMLPMGNTLNLCIYSFHIPLFFIISGILLFNKNRLSNFNTPIWQIVKKKSSSLLYPYFVFSLFSLVATIIYSYFDNSVRIVDRIISIFTFDGIMALWFLPALFVAEILFIFLKKTLKKDIYIISVLAIIAIITSLFCRNYEHTSDAFLQKYIFSYLNILNRGLIGSVFVGIGYYLMKIKTILKANKGFVIAISVLSMVVCSSLILIFHNYIDLHYSIIGNPIVFYLSSISGSVFVVSLCYLFSAYNINMFILCFWGKNSLIIFATHFNLYITRWVYYIVIFDVFKTIQAFAMILIIESILIVLINKWCDFIYNYQSLKLIIKKC